MTPLGCAEEERADGTAPPLATAALPPGETDQMAGGAGDTDGAGGATAAPPTPDSPTTPLDAPEDVPTLTPEPSPADDALPLTPEPARSPPDDTPPADDSRTSPELTPADDKPPEEPPTVDAGAGDAGTEAEPEEPFNGYDHPHFVGNITTRDRVDTDGFIYADYWDQITPENAGKWGSVQQNAGGQFNWATLDAIYDYALEHNLIFKEHAFVWGRQQPAQGNIGEAEVREWMTAFCERYPRTSIIDVVNEPPPHTTPDYVNSIGGGTNGSWQWITNSFIWAKEACPNSVLLLNDFNNIEWAQDHSHFLNIVRTIQEAGAPVDALGAQAHDLDHGQVRFSAVRDFMDALHEGTGLPLYITEYDFSTSDDGAQLNAYQEHVAHFLATDYVPGITIWGWIYGKTWNSAPESGLIRNGGPRPAMTWLMEELGRPVPQ